MILLCTQCFVYMWIFSYVFIIRHVRNGVSLKPTAWSYIYIYEITELIEDFACIIPHVMECFLSRELTKLYRNHTTLLFLFLFFFIFKFIFLFCFLNCVFNRWWWEIVLLPGGGMDIVWTQQWYLPLTNLSTIYTKIWREIL